jgi:hypothetical protein
VGVLRQDGVPWGEARSDDRMRVFPLGADESRSTADDAAATCDARRRARGCRRRTRTCLWPPPASATWHCAHFVLNIFAPARGRENVMGRSARASARAEARGGDDARIARSREGNEAANAPLAMSPAGASAKEAIVRVDRASTEVAASQRERGRRRRKGATVERSAQGEEPLSRVCGAPRDGRAPQSVRARAHAHGVTRAHARPRTDPRASPGDVSAAPARDGPRARRAAKANPTRPRALRHLGAIHRSRRSRWRRNKR